MLRTISLRLATLLTIVAGFGTQARALPGEPAAASGAAARATASARSIFRQSHIPIWCDGPTDHQTYNADVLVQDFDIVDAADVPKWRAFVAARHAAGQLVCAEMRPLTHIGNMLEFAMNDAGMQEAVCRDLDLQPIPIGWMKEHPYKGRIPPFYCSNHPRYREFLRQQIRFFVQAGADGVMVDDGGGSPFALSHGGCFCRYCTDGFRQYLRTKYPAARLREQGVENPETFDYRQFALRRAGNLASYRKLRTQGQIPFSGDFQRFLRDSDVALFRELQGLASQLVGRPIPMGWDNVDSGGQYAPYYPFWDVFYSEITYQNFHVAGKGPADILPASLVAVHKLTDALGKWYTPTPGPRSWQAVMEGNLTGLLRQWTAFTYANGGAMRYPRKGWVFSETTPWYFPPQAEFEPLYDFIRRNRVLFDGYRAVEQVGVLFTQSRGGFGAAYYTPLKRLCAQLVDANVPFGFAVAGDDELANRLTGAEATRFELMLVPEPLRLVDGQQAVVDRWIREGRALTLGPGDDLAAKLAGRVTSPITLESRSDVWLFPRTAAADSRVPLVCHLVSSKYDPKANRSVAQSNVAVRLTASLWGRAPVERVTYHAPGRAPRDLPFAVRDGALRVTVSEVDLWGILAVHCSSPSVSRDAGWMDLFDGSTLHGWAQTNGTATYRVVDGTIVGRTTEGSWNSFLCTEREFGDFELEFEAKVDARLNSGVQIRSKTRDKTVGEGPNNAAGRVIGPQVEIEASGQKGAEAGYIYSEATGRGWLTPPDRLVPHKHFVDGQWNRFRVVAEGPRIRTWINGVLIDDLTDEAAYREFPRGFIGLQVHRIKPGTGPYEAAWRQIRLREL